jgi:hypothetical protein
MHEPAVTVTGMRGCPGYARTTKVVSAVSGLGADATRLRTVTTSLLHYGQISAEGPTDVHLVFDHRLIDGLGGARI